MGWSEEVRLTSSIPRIVGVGLLVATLGVTAASCTVRDDGRPAAEIDGLGSSLREIRRLARDEGRLDLVVWPGYADEAWAGAFTRQTGCVVHATDARDADEMVGLMRGGNYDGVSTSGEVSGLLMASGDVAPVDPGLIPNYEQLQEGFKNQAFNSRDGQPYGVPLGRSPNLLTFRTDAVPEDTTSWEVVWGGATRHTGRLSIYDGAIYIADAATYLRTTRPELGIDDPYQLNEEQFQAAIGLLREQARHVGEYWRRNETTQIESFRSGESAVGTSRPDRVRAMEAEGVPVKAIKPVEGATGSSDTWMISSSAANPNCMYLWMDYVVSAAVQAQISETFGLAPANLAACELTTDPDHCTTLHADDEPWWDDVYYWATPAADCGDPVRSEECKTWEEWKTAWAELRG